MTKLARDLKKDESINLAGSTCRIVKVLRNNYGEIILHIFVPNLILPKSRRKNHNAMLIVPNKFEVTVIEDHFVT